MLFYWNDIDYSTESFLDVNLTQDFRKNYITEDYLNHFAYWFNHGWDSIYKYSLSSSWFTDKSRRPLSTLDIWNKWNTPNSLIGLRFGTITRYGLIDIDNDSQYHSEDGLKAIKGALEDIGINDTVLIRSSDNDGWHLYYFLPQAVNSFRLAQAVAIALRENSLYIDAGQLEIFPNIKSYDRDKVTMFNGHRLPLQESSYILDKDFQPYSNSITTFLSHAEESGFSCDFDLLGQAINTAGDRYTPKSVDNIIVNLKWFTHNMKAKKWKTESERLIKAGWTANHQSNDLLGIIAEYGRVFKGFDDESELTSYVIKTAIACPGYGQYCRHQCEIEAWSTRWARCAMLHRFPYGSRNGGFKEISKGGPTNEEKIVLTQMKLSECVEDLIAVNRLEKRVKARETQLVLNLGISKGTLWKKNYLPLWHPKYMSVSELTETQSLQGIEESSPNPARNCVLSFVVAAEAENNLLILPIEGSDQNIDQDQSSKITQSNSQVISFLLSSEIDFARFSTLKNSETLDLQAFKARKYTEKMNNFMINHSEILKIGDCVYHGDRPTYGLTITQIVNDELVKAKTDGFSGAELFAISELVLFPITNKTSRF